MTAKEYLSQARLLDARINAKIQQVSALNDLATHATATLTGMPRNPSRSESRMAEAVVKIIDLQNEINHDIDELVDLNADASPNPLPCGNARGAYPHGRSPGPSGWYKGHGAGRGRCWEHSGGLG